MDGKNIVAALQDRKFQNHPSLPHLHDGERNRATESHPARILNEDTAIRGL